MGKLLWKNTDRGNIWHVTAGNVNNDPRPEVLTTAADGKVHIYDSQGRYLRSLDPGFYATTVRWWQLSQKKPIVRRQEPSVIQSEQADEPGLIIVAGGDGPKSRLAALDSRGDAQWSLEIPAPVTNMAIAVERPWLALSCQDGNVCVVDLAAGREIARVGGQGAGANVAWLPVDESPPLLVIVAKRQVASLSNHCHAALASAGGILPRILSFSVIWRRRPRLYLQTRCTLGLVGGSHEA